MTSSDVTGSAIPVVDFAAYGLDRENFNDLIVSVRDALTSVGFMYLFNHGIPSAEIDNAFSQSRRFFELSTATKRKYDRGSSHHGYGSEREQLNPRRPVDLKECFDYAPGRILKMPDDELPEFKVSLSTLFGKCTQLSNRVLEVIGRGLSLEDPYVFVEAHTGIGSEHSNTTLRSLYYPPIAEDADIRTGQLRCGEHSDYGSITLLIQDNEGGLEVETRKGEFVPAVPMEGTIVVNIGDLMQRWTSDQLVSNVHRVVMPKTAEAKCSGRQSMAFFCNPDNAYIVRCVDNSEKYPPIASGEYLNQRVTATYHY